VNDSAQETAAI